MNPHIHRESKKQDVKLWMMIDYWWQSVAFFCFAANVVMISLLQILC